MEKTLGDEEVSFLPPLLGYSFHRSLRVDSSGNIPRITKNKTDRADLRFLYSSTGSFDIPNACILFYTCVIIIIRTAIKLSSCPTPFHLFLSIVQSSSLMQKLLRERWGSRGIRDWKKHTSTRAGRVHVNMYGFPMCLPRRPKLSG